MISVHRLHLTDVTPAPLLPWARPMYPVFSYLVIHPSGPILIDTGVGIGNPTIDDLYSPVHHDLDEALNRHGVTVGEVETVITSHLHFDHCGQNQRFLVELLSDRTHAVMVSHPFGCQFRADQISEVAATAGATAPAVAFCPLMVDVDLAMDHRPMDRWSTWTSWASIGMRSE